MVGWWPWCWDLAAMIIGMADTSHINFCMLAISPYRLLLHEARLAMSFSVGFVFELNLGDVTVVSVLKNDL